MKRALLLIFLAVVMAAGYLKLAPLQQAGGEVRSAGAGLQAGVQDDLPQDDAAETGLVLDISVHTLDELKVLLDRAEEIAMRQQTPGETARVVLVLHGPEVEFFSVRNYSRYKEIVDQAARLDAFDVVDVKICRSMMDRLGVDRADIPAFIEQVPYGPGEVERLVREGYVYF